MHADISAPSAVLDNDVRGARVEDGTGARTRNQYWRARRRGRLWQLEVSAARLLDCTPVQCATAS